MARLPVDGGDRGEEFAALNEFLLVAHNANGTLKLIGGSSVARLPTIDGDHEVWDALLNEFLLVAHNADGTLKDEPVVVVDNAGAAVLDNDDQSITV